MRTNQTQDDGRNTENNSEATTETVAENTNANLSMEDLAASPIFAENAESAPEENSTTEATDDVTESEAVDAAEEQEGDVLSQPTNPNKKPKREDSSKEPKGLQKAIRQINRLTARAKGAEEEVSALKAQIESLKSQLAQEAEPQGKPALR